MLTFPHVHARAHTHQVQSSSFHKLEKLSSDLSCGADKDDRGPDDAKDLTEVTGGSGLGWGLDLGLGLATGLDLDLDWALGLT